MDIMSIEEIDLLAAKIAEHLMNDDRFTEKVAKAIGSKPVKKLVSAKEAAAMLGISVMQLYHIKDDENGTPRFSYIKTGSSKQASLKFDSSKLMKEYERYIATR